MFIANIMLINLIDSYINDRNKVHVIRDEYWNLDNHESHDFYGDRINVNSVIRILNTMNKVFMLQLILNKKVYLPWVGLFAVYPKNFETDYTFPESFLEMEKMFYPWDKKRKLVHDQLCSRSVENGKIDFDFLENSSVQVRTNIKQIWDDKISFLSKYDTKVKYLNGKVKEFMELNFEKKNYEWIRISLVQKYTWARDFKSIVEDNKKHQEYSILNLLDCIVTEDMLMNRQLIKDVFLLVGYIENNKSKLGVASSI